MKVIRSTTRLLVRCQSSAAGNQTEAQSQGSVSAAKLADFWAEAGKNLSWSSKYGRALDVSNPRLPKWYVGGKMNTCYNCVDRHIEEGRGDQVAIVYESSVSSSQQRIVYSELHDNVSRLAGAFVDNGLRTGDRVLIFMPAIPQAIYAMLACARMGATYIPMSGAVSAKELAAIIDHAKPRLVLSANAGIESYRPTDYKAIMDDALELAEHSPGRHFVYQRPGFAKSATKRARDLDWDSAMRATRSRLKAIPVDANYPLFMEYQADQTGALNGIVRPNGGHAAALSWTLEHAYGVSSKANEKWFVANDANWAANHSLVVFAPLLNAVTTVLFEGNVDASNCFSVTDKHACNVVLTSTSTVRAMCAQDPDRKHANHYNFDSLHHVVLSGDAHNGSWRAFTEKLFRAPVYNSVWNADAQLPADAALPVAASTASKAFDASNMLSVLQQQQKNDRPTSSAN